jgi:hypothetical protein
MKRFKSNLPSEEELLLLIDYVENSDTTIFDEKLLDDHINSVIDRLEFSNLQLKQIAKSKGRI